MKTTLFDHLDEELRAIEEGKISGSGSRRRRQPRTGPGERPMNIVRPTGPAQAAASAGHAVRPVASYATAAAASAPVSVEDVQSIHYYMRYRTKPWDELY
jgi:hypothetical protein